MDLLQELKHRLDTNPEPLWLKDKVLKRNEFLSMKGNSERHLYFVEQGALRVFIEDETAEHTIRFGYPGSFITSLDSFITGRPSVFNIQALKKTDVKVLDKTSFQRFMQQDPANLILWQQITEFMLYQQVEREIDILTSSPLERYNRVLARSPRLFQEIPHKYIASYLRMTPETLSRLKKS